MNTARGNGKYGSMVITGAIGPIIALIFVVTDILISPWFTWSESSLSDLGVHPYSFLFNYGLIIEAILNIFFVYSLKRQFRLKASIAIILLIGGLSLGFVGIFNEHYGDIHLTLALIYFILFPAGIILFSLSGISKGKFEAPFGIILSIVGLAFIIAGILQLFGLFKTPFGLGFYEFVEAVALIIWSVEASLYRTLKPFSIRKTQA